jgi:hypothetical protein
LYQGNVNRNNAGYNFGGVFFIEADPSGTTETLSFSNCVIKDNRAPSGAFFGSRTNATGSVPYRILLDNCYIVGNKAVGTAGNNGGGLIQIGDNATATAQQWHVLATNSVFTSNTARTDGGILCVNAPKVQDSFRFVNCSIVGNKAEDEGAAFHLSSANTNLQVINCLFMNNAAGSTRELIRNPKVLNSNLMYNTVRFSDGVTTRPHWSESTAGTVQITNNLPMLPAHTGPNPLLVSAVPGGDFHLSPGSPAISAANAAFAPALDYDGATRPLGLGYDIGAFEAQPAPTIAYTSTLGLGQTLTNVAKEASLIVTNSGEQALTITTVTLVSGDSAFTVKSIPTAAINAGSTGTIVVEVLSSTAGAKTATFDIASNAASSPDSFVANATITLPPPAISFATPLEIGSTPTNTPLEGSLAVSNLSGSDLVISTVTQVSGDAGFTVKSIPAAIAAPGSGNIVVEILSAVAGAKTATFQIVSNDPASPHSFVANATVTSAVVEDPEISLEASLEIGEVQQSTAGQKTLVVGNTGEGALNISAVSFVSGDAGFSIVSFPPTIAVGNTGNIVVSINSAVLGPKSAVFSIISNDPNSPTVFTVTADVVLASIYVTTNGTGTGASWDSPTNLPAAMAAFNPAVNSAIRLKEGLYQPVTTLAPTSPQVWVGGYDTSLTGTDLSLQSADNATTLSGQNARRIVQIVGVPNANFTARSLIFANGLATSGAALDVTSGPLTVTFEDCTLINNRATSGGGAVRIFAREQTDLVFDGCLVTSNAITLAGGTGGAIQLNGGLQTLWIKNSTISENHNLVTDGYGGAIKTFGKPTTIYVEDSRIIGNRTNHYGGFISMTGSYYSTNTLYQGNNNVNTGVYVYSGVMFNEADAEPGPAQTVSFYECDFLSNEAPAGAAFGARLSGTSGVVYTHRFTNCYFEDNFARGTGGSNGGAIFMITEDNSTNSPKQVHNLIATNCVFTSNTTRSDGAILCVNRSQGVSSYSFYNCSIVGNTAQDEGVAFWASAATTNIKAYNCLFANNVAGDGEELIRNPKVIDSCLMYNTVLISDPGTTLSHWTEATAGTVVVTNNLPSNPLQKGPDPMLRNPALGGDFRLKAGSPAINAANAAFAPGTDFNGITRPQPDIGAFEYLPAPWLVYATPQDIGTAGQGVAKQGTLSIGNNGDTELSISAVNVLANNAGFSVVSFPATVAVGATADIVVEINSTTVGGNSATLEIVSNDLDSPGSLVVNATVILPGPASVEHWTLY